MDIFRPSCNNHKNLVVLNVINDAAIMQSYDCKSTLKINLIKFHFHLLVKYGIYL